MSKPLTVDHALVAWIDPEDDPISTGVRIQQFAMTPAATLACAEWWLRWTTDLDGEHRGLSMPGLELGPEQEIFVISADAGTFHCHRPGVDVRPLTAASALMFFRSEANFNLSSVFVQRAQQQAQSQQIAAAVLGNGGGPR